jgi:ATP-binding cassette subfamily C protein
MILGALAEGIGILILVPLAAIAIGSDSALPILAEAVGGMPANQRFLVMLLFFIAAMAARAALTYARDIQLAHLLAGYEASLRLRAASMLARRGWPFASRIGQAGMQTLLLTDVPRAGVAVSQAQQFAAAAAVLLIQLGLAALLSARFAGIALIILSAAFAVSLPLTRRGVKSGMALVQRYEQSAGSGFRLHASLKAALAQGAVPEFLQEYDATLTSTRDESIRSLRDLALARSLAFLGSAVAAGLLFFVGYRLLELPFPILVTSLVLFARLVGPAQQLQQSAQNVALYSPSFAAIVGRLGKLQPVVAEGASPEPLEWRQLRIDNVRFEHQPGLGLERFSADLEPGEWLGLAGPSGSGKTTLLDLVAGLLVPQNGMVTVDGETLERNRLERWRASLSYVGQEGSIFDDSVRRNLITNDAAQNDDLWQVLELVGLADRVRSFSKGLDEHVGDRGSALSGGERQRLAIARALLRKPSLLILDEATSALDADSESALLDRLRALDPRPAVLIVAHRASTLAHCDSVVSIQHERQIEAADRADSRDDRA